MDTFALIDAKVIIYVGLAIMFMRNLLFIILMSCVATINAQFYDDFSKSGWDNYWNGNSNSFSYSKQMGLLVLNASVQHANIYRTSTVLDSAQWDVTIIYSQTYGENNYFRYYLACEGDINDVYSEAFYIQVADTSFAVSLYHRKNGIANCVLKSEKLYKSSNNICLAIKVKKDCYDTWSIYVRNVAEGETSFRNLGNISYSALFQSRTAGFAVNIDRKADFTFAIAEISAAGKAQCGGSSPTDPEEPDNPNLDGSVRPQRHDIVISEIMSDPSPTVMLPECEYIEIFNRTDKRLNLSGYKLWVGTRCGTIEDSVLEPGEYAVLCSSASYKKMKQYGKVISVSSMPALINEGRITYITSPDTVNAITWLDYSSSWYGTNSFKKNGGWSLERYYCNNLNPIAEYWSASIDKKGGTPCAANSVEHFSPDTTPFEILGTGVFPSDTLFVAFNKELSSSFSSSSIYVSDDIKFDVQLGFPEQNTIFVSLEQSMDKYETISLSLSDITDISGFGVSDTTILFTKPSVPSENDLIINELMSLPHSGAPKYIEIFNTSGYCIDLSSVYVAPTDQYGMPASLSQISNMPYILPPNAFAIITDNTSEFSGYYDYCISAQLLQMPLSLLKADSANVAITLSDGTIIDMVSYSSSWHHPWLSDFHGVSLERIDPMGPSCKSDNWHSAASTANYATPGCVNSQMLQLNETTSQRKHFWLENDYFTPDNDGWADFVSIYYTMPNEGYTASIKIFSPNGEYIGYVTNNELLGQSGYILWDGTDGNGSILSVGVYVLLIEASNPNGATISQKLIAVIAAN